MKVKELLEKLQSINPEYEVVLARDEEGNGFSVFSGDIGYHAIVEKGPHIENIYLIELTPELEEEGYDEEDVGDLDHPDRQNVIILWP
jgi:hypothetical protein